MLRIGSLINEGSCPICGIIFNSVKHPIWDNIKIINRMKYYTLIGIIYVFIETLLKLRIN